LRLHDVREELDGDQRCAAVGHGRRQQRRYLDAGDAVRRRQGVRLRLRGRHRGPAGLHERQVRLAGVIYFAARARRHASQTLAGVAGISMWSAAPLGMALDIAFMTAAIAAVVPASPVPFTPSGLLVAGTECTASRSSIGMWWACGMP